MFANYNRLVIIDTFIPVERKPYTTFSVGYGRPVSFRPEDGQNPSFAVDGFFSNNSQIAVAGSTNQTKWIKIDLQHSYYIELVDIRFPQGM